ncbi:MAG TPA: hypothetical protein VFZ61_06980, partial [Polyangiales bacterium]
MTRIRLHLAYLSLSFLLACGTPRPPAPSPSESAVTPVGPAGSDGGQVVSEGDALKPRDDLPAERRALVVVDGEERWIDAQAAVSAGYTLVDLSDGWTPLIFREEHGANGEPLPNRYRRVFLGLANDQLDSDGVALEPGRKNYLELYGIFPSLSVLRARFMTDQNSACHDQESVDVLSAVETVSYVPPQNLEKDQRKLAKLQFEVENARKRAKLATLAELAAAQPEFQPKVELVEKRAAEKLAMAAVERRLTCEQLLTPQMKHKTGIYDEPMRLAVRAFQHKNMIYEANFLR